MHIFSRTPVVSFRFKSSSELTNSAYFVETSLCADRADSNLVGFSLGKGMLCGNFGQSTVKIR